MVTFKQLEAIYWAVQLGGFAQAANKLHTTQSAISKRIQEVEAMFDTPLFDRSLRSARLTDKGDEMYILASRLIVQRDTSLEQFQRPEALERRVRLGVTELTAMTWLPRLVEAIKLRYPKVVIQPQVDASSVLREKLLADEVDLIIAPASFDDDQFASSDVGVAEHCWMCKPGFLTRRKLRLSELVEHQLLVQDSRSGTGQLYGRWMRSLGLEPTQTVTSNSVVALIGLTVSGMGISYLPRRCLEPLMEAGALQMLSVTPALPPTRYAAFRKANRPGALLSTIAELCQKTCDFSETFQIQRGAAAGASRAHR